MKSFVYTRTSVQTYKEFKEAHDQGIPVDLISFPSMCLNEFKEKSFLEYKNDREGRFLAIYFKTYDRTPVEHQGLLLVELFKEAFLAHNPEALYLLALFYAEGYLVRYNPKSVFDLLTQSSGFGLKLASFQLGLCYYHGIGIKPDLNKAKLCFYGSQEIGDFETEVYLCAIDLIQSKTLQQTKKIIEKLEDLEKKGSKTAGFFLGNAEILFGVGEKRFEKAKEHFATVSSIFVDDAKEMIEELSAFYRSLSHYVLPDTKAINANN